MLYLSNAANAVLESVRDSQMEPSEFGYRFQILVVEALKVHPKLGDLYDNRGAGQPDCYSNAEHYGFEIKARTANPLQLDDSSWDSLVTYEHPRLVAMLTTKAPYPIWVAKLDDLNDEPIRLSRDTSVDLEIEQHLKVTLGNLIEAVGVNGLVSGSRHQVIERSQFAIEQATRHE